MGKMVRSYEEWKKATTPIMAGRGCACVCYPESGEPEFDVGEDHNGCLCAPPNTHESIND